MLSYCVKIVLVSFVFTDLIKEEHMKKFTRISSFLLALIMVLSTLASCAPETPNVEAPDTTKQSTSDTTAASSDTTEQGEVNLDASKEEKILPNLPDVRYDGYEYRIRCVGSARLHWETLGIYAEAKTGEPINDATLERNNYIEEKYGIKIVQTEGEDVANSVNTMVLSQLDEIDLAISAVSNIGSVAPQSVLDLNQIEALDLTKPWYDQNFNQEISIGGKLYATTGDLLINDDNGTWCVLFNKRIANDYKIEGLYDLVFDGKWTLDKAYELAKLVTKEDSGDNKLDYNDQWGLVTESYNGYAMVASTGEKIAKKDSDDMPYLTANTEKFQNVFEKAVRILGDRSVVAFPADWWTDDPNWENPFKEGRGLFVMAGLYDLDEVRGINDEVGVLTMPKYEESQEIAYSPVTVSNFTISYIPITVSDIERTAVITEALYAESRYTTRVAFYETTLKSKYSPDQESKKVLDMVIDNRTFDLGAIYGWGAVITKLRTLMEVRNPNFASSWKSIERVAERALDLTVKNFQKAEK